MPPELASRLEPGEPALAPKEAAVPRRWIGPPDSAWNPTLSLMSGCVLGTAGLAFAMRGAHVPVWLGVAGLAVCYYVVFTLHDAMHDVAHRTGPSTPGSGA